MMAAVVYAMERYILVSLEYLLDELWLYFKPKDKIMQSMKSFQSKWDKGRQQTPWIFIAIDRSGLDTTLATGGRQQINLLNLLTAI